MNVQVTDLPSAGLGNAYGRLALVERCDDFEQSNLSVVWQQSTVSHGALPNAAPPTTLACTVSAHDPGCAPAGEKADAQPPVG
jgi:hypothetical protein